MQRRDGGGAERNLDDGRRLYRERLGIQLAPPRMFAEIETPRDIGGLALQHGTQRLDRLGLLVVLVFREDIRLAEHGTMEHDHAGRRVECR